MTGASLPLPSPLREVFELEGVGLPSFVTAALADQDPSGLYARTESAEVQMAPEAPQSHDSAPSPFNPAHCLRWELYGLPGLGKSTLAHGLPPALRNRRLETLVMPEAVPYAVHVHGIALPDLEPFLDLVNPQAEALARAAADRVASMPEASRPSLVIIRDPAHQQNECYRYVLHALARADDPAGRLLRRLGEAVAAGSWSDIIAQEAGALLWERHPALRAVPAGRWARGHLLLTTEDPVLDITLSLKRQRNGGRHEALVTDDLPVLAGYLATLRYAEAASRDGTFECIHLDPGRPSTAVLEQVAHATYHFFDKD